MAQENLVHEIAQLLYDKKAKDIVALHVAPLTVLTEHMVIATGHNPLQVRALCDHVDEFMHKKGIEPRRVEGKSEASWIVMDYNNIIVHLFKADSRAFYRLERLWDDGQNRLSLPFMQEAEI